MSVFLHLQHRPLITRPSPCFISPTPLPSPPYLRTLPLHPPCPSHRTPTPRLSLSPRRRLPPTARIALAQVPMALTWARVAAIPLLCITTLSPSLSSIPFLSASLFAVASFTDFLDGYLARRWRVESALGVFLDPVADKLLVAVALTVLVARLQTPALTLAASVILAREIFVSALREWMAKLGLSVVVKVSVWGKIKTAMQMVAVTLLLAVRDPGGSLAAVGIAGAVVSAVLAVFSASEYVVAALHAYKKGGAT